MLSHQINLIEYSLSLSTGERIDISELDPGVLGEFWDAKLEDELRPILELCSVASRHVVEEAKIGYDSNFKGLLRDPLGALLRLNKPSCALIRECPMADRKGCDTRNSNKRGGMFPLCWEYAVDLELDEEIRARASAIAAAIVHAWRRRHYVLFIRD